MPGQKDDRDLDELVRRARKHQMTEEEMREQRISFVFGNLAIGKPGVTKEFVRKVAHEMEQGNTLKP